MVAAAAVRFQLRAAEDELDTASLAEALTMVGRQY
jgi:hypothetical protein